MSDLDAAVSGMYGRRATFSQRAGEPLHRVAPGNPYIKIEPEEVERSISTRFEQQARRWPMNIAVTTATHELTYAALNRAAHQLADLLLQERGNGAEHVGLLIKHGAPMMTALLAVLKAGKFYFPLDPKYPRDRLACILDDAQVGIVLTSDALVGVANDLAGPNLRVLSVDTVASGHSTENTGLSIEPEAFAYLLYTSGSTGQSKGVIENHRNVMHFTMVRTHSCHIAPEDNLVPVGYPVADTEVLLLDDDGRAVGVGEIENALLALAGVSAAVVVAREDQPGDRRLIAYIVLGGGAGPKIGAPRSQPRFPTT